MYAQEREQYEFHLNNEIMKDIDFKNHKVQISSKTSGYECIINLKQPFHIINANQINNKLPK